MEVETWSNPFPVEASPATFGPTGDRDLARLLNNPRTCLPVELLAALIEIAHRTHAEADRVLAYDSSAGLIVTPDETRIWVPILHDSEEVTEHQIKQLREISNESEILLVTSAPLHPRAEHHISKTPGFDWVRLTVE